VKMEDGGPGRAARGGEHHGEAVAVDHVMTVQTLRRVESDFSELRQEPNERNTKTTADKVGGPFRTSRSMPT
jgi:hypothetical protein